MNTNADYMSVWNRNGWVTAVIGCSLKSLA
jgi:hypothetical protein